MVVCSGAYQRPHRTPLADALPRRVTVLDADGYTAPGDLPPGPVLVIGSGQTGCQLAEELRGAGREVFLSCGRAMWLARRMGGRDILWWALETGFLDATVESLPSPAARFAANISATGRHGGDHDLTLRTLHAMGVRLLGHLEACDGRHARFADDLAASVAWGDERRADFVALVRKLVAERGLPEPELPDPEPLRAEPLLELDLDGFGAVILTAGYRPDYASWVDVPGAFDALGFPLHEAGAVDRRAGAVVRRRALPAPAPSALLCGVGEDAAMVAGGIAAAA